MDVNILSFLKVRAPVDLRQQAPDVLHALEQLDRLLLNPASSIRATFAATRGYDVKAFDALFPVNVRFEHPAAYNNHHYFAGEDPVAEEFGWFDARVSLDTLFINAAYYDRSVINAANKLVYLPILAFTTAVHELQHYLAFHCKVPSPQSPLPASPPSDYNGPTSYFAREAGDEWEVRVLRGAVDTLCATSDAPFQVVGLALRFVEAGEEKWVIPSEAWVCAVQEAMNGTAEFPLLAEAAPVSGSTAPSMRRRKGRRCRFVEDDDKSLIGLAVPAPGLVYRRHKNDRRGPRDH